MLAAGVDVKNRNGFRSVWRIINADHAYLGYVVRNCLKQQQIKRRINQWSLTPSKSLAVTLVINVKGLAVPSIAAKKLFGTNVGGFWFRSMLMRTVTVELCPSLLLSKAATRT